MFKEENTPTAEALTEILSSPETRVEHLTQLFNNLNDRKVDLKAYTIFVNDPLAKHLLKFNMSLHPNLSNRPVTPAVIEYLANQVLAGTMRNTGEPLLFTSEGDGIDLQHRLLSVIRAAEKKADAGYWSTVIVGVPIHSTDELIENLLVMGTTKRTTRHLAHFAGVDASVWKAVEYAMLPIGARPGSMTTAHSRADVNREYKRQKAYYDSAITYIEGLFGDAKDGGIAGSTYNVNLPLGAKRKPIYVAAYIQMQKKDEAKAREFMEAFFNPLDNTLQKGNPVDAIRNELPLGFATQFRDDTRPITVRDSMLKAFDFFLAGERRTHWKREDFELPLIRTSNLSSANVPARRAAAAGSTAIQ